MPTPRTLRPSDAARIEELGRRIAEAVWLALDHEPEFTADDIGPIAFETVAMFRARCRDHLASLAAPPAPPPSDAEAAELRLPSRISA